jgi:hypothetical protein
MSKYYVKLFSAALAGAALFGAATSASAATLLGQTINGSIKIDGQDDNGFYTIDVLVGPVSVAGGFSNTYNVFKQLTQGGFATPSNRLTGDITLNITADTIAVRFNGQAQPFQLTSSFTGIAGNIINVVNSSTGIISGVNMDAGNSFTASSVSFSTIYFGFQPGTDVTQTEKLTFAAVTGAVPESATWAMMIVGFGLVGGALRRDRKRYSLA